MRVAIVGSGVSGLSALWLLKQYSEHEVNIYEKNDYVGGHAHSVEFRGDGKDSCFVDTGFMSFNPTSSPNFLRFLKLLGVPLVRAERSLSVSRDGRYQWSTNGDGTLFGLTKFLNPRGWRTSFDTLRFNYFALDLLLEGNDDDEQLSLAQWLAREGYSRAFFNDYLLPLISLIWLVPDDHTALNLPAKMVIAALADNAMLQNSKHLRFLSVEGGAKTYIDQITSIVPPENLHLNTSIVSISSLEYGVKLVEASGAEHIYDHVILATPAHVTLSMLERGGWVSDVERKVLTCMEWMRIESEVHRDDKGVAGDAAVNYMTTPAPPAYDPSSPGRTQQISVTVDMNTIEALDKDKYGPVRVTFNPPWPVDDNSPRWQYEVPYMISSSAARLRHLPEIQNTRRISYVGAWTRRGRHEDGFSSSMALVTAPPFCAIAPFAFEDHNNDTNTTATTTCNGTDTVTVIKTKANADWRRGDAIGRAAINIAEALRRRAGVLWPWVAWPIVLALTVAGFSARLGGWKSLERTLRDLANGWKGITV